MRRVGNIALTRFECLSSFDEQAYYLGDQLSFHYTDRMAYRQPTTPTVVTFQYVQQVHYNGG